MKLLKGYKGIVFIYLILTIVNVIWVISYDKPDEVRQVNKDANIVYNA